MSPASIGPFECGKARPVISRSPGLNVTWVALVLLLTFLSAACSLSGGPFGPNLISKSGQESNGRITVSTNLPPATVGTPYNSILTIRGGSAPYKLSVTGGTLPRGFTLDSSTGSLSGMPHSTGKFGFTVLVKDADDDHGETTLSLKVEPPNGGSHISVAISPATIRLVSGSTQRFTATVRDTSYTAVSWSTTAGTISDSGLFRSPSVTRSKPVTVTATSLVDPKAQASASLVITPPSPPPPPPPPPPSDGADNRYCDPGDVPNFGSSDGPAAVPTGCFHTAVSATPSSGAVVQVSPGSSLQIAINNAHCGDTLVLQGGQTYSGFTLPAKNCDASHYISIRSAAIGSGLPDEGTRVTPCYAGVSSLPGRPAFNCVSTAKVMATITGTKNQINIINNTAGANYYRLIGLEIADTGMKGAWGYYDLVMLKYADHIIFDRCWVHGTATNEDVRGIAFDNSSYIGIIDSTISDIHSKTSGWGADSAAISSLTGPGPVKIVNNFIEAAGENILWGGGASQTNVSDVEIRRNHLFKPLIWWQSNGAYFGTLFLVKNLFESKTGVREFVEGNIFENNWKMGQKGTAILFYPKNQYGTCPGCTVHDIVFRYNIVRHTVNALGIGVTKATTCPGESGGGTGHCSYLSASAYNISIHDNLLDDVNQSVYSPGSCCSDGALINLDTDQQQNWPHDISIEHNTGFPVGSGIGNAILNGPPQVISNFSFNNNLFGAGNYGFHSLVNATGNPGCALHGVAGAIGTLEGCMGTTWTFTNNAIIASKSPAPASPYPSTGNCGTLSSCLQFFASDWGTVGFVNYNQGNLGDYHLLSSSPYKNAGTDGRDLGADIDGLMNATAGVL